MSLNFPDTSGSPPTDGSFTHTENGLTYSWDGEKWNLVTEANNGGVNYVLPTATAIRLGGIKVGENLTVEPDGTLNASDGAAGTLQEVTDAGNTTTNSIVINDNISLNADGELLVGSESDHQVRIATPGTGANARAIITSRNPSTATNNLNTFNVEKGGVETMRICVDGTTKIGGTPNGSPNITLNADGSSSFAKGNLTIEDDGRLECFDQVRVSSNQGFLARGNGSWPTSFAFRSFDSGVEKMVLQITSAVRWLMAMSREKLSPALACCCRNSRCASTADCIAAKA